MMTRFRRDGALSTWFGRVPEMCLSHFFLQAQHGIRDDKRTILFFGRITPYKGLEYLTTAFQQVLARCDDYRLIVVGRPENDCQSYWSAIEESIRPEVRRGRVLVRADHIPDDETEL